MIDATLELLMWFLVDVVLLNTSFDSQFLARCIVWIAQLIGTIEGVKIVIRIIQVWRGREKINGKRN